MIVPGKNLGRRCSLCPGSRGYSLAIGSPARQFSVAPTNHAFSSEGGNGVVSVKADGSQSFEPVARFDEEKKQLVAAPINLDSASENAFPVLFGTGLRNRSSLGAVSMKIGGVNALLR